MMYIDDVRRAVVYEPVTLRETQDGDRELYIAGKNSVGSKVSVTVTLSEDQAIAIIEHLSAPLLRSISAVQDRVTNIRNGHFTLPVTED